MSDRLQEIRARLEVAQDYRVEWPDYKPGTLAEFIAHAPADIAWLLDEVEETRHRLACAAIDVAGEVAVSSDDREWHLARYGVTPEEAEKASDRRYQESRERGSRNA